MSQEQKLLKDTGFALFGKRWQTSVAVALGLSDARRIRQWMSGDRPIPPGIWYDLLGLLKIRRGVIDIAIEDLSKMLTPEELSEINNLLRGIKSC